MSFVSRRFFTIAALAAFLFLPSAAFAQLLISSGLLQKKTAAPGQTYHETMVIRNGGIAEERVRLYQTDYRFYADGSNHFDDPGSNPRSNADWIQLPYSEIIIPPGHEEEVAYSVSVPAAADLIGTYWSIVMIQSITRSILNPEQPVEGEVAVTSGTRYAVQVVTHIGSSGSRSLVFSKTAIERNGERYVLRINAANDGQRRLEPAFYMDLYSEKGAYIGRFESRRLGLYPGTSARILFPLTGMRPGRYKAQVVADAGGDDLFGAIYSLTLSE
jgi:hypothetical protein